MKLHHLLLWALFCTACPGESPPEGKPMPDHGKIILIIPRDPAADESLKLNVTVGTLPARARIVLHSGRGELLGSISPFGKTGNRPRVSYAIPVSREEIIDRKLTLIFTLEQSGQKIRVPTDAEILAVKLHLGS